MTFWQTKDAVLCKLVADKGLTINDLRVGVFLVTRLNNGTLTAWPGNEGISEATGLPERSVTRSLSHLEERGHYRATGPKGGRGKATEYAPGCAAQNPDRVVTLFPPKPRQGCQGLDGETPSALTVNPVSTDTPYLEDTLIEGGARSEALLAKQTKRASSRKYSLPKDWQPPKNKFEWATQEIGYSLDELRAVHREWLRYWRGRSETQRTQAGWVRTWVTNVSRRAQQTPPKASAVLY